MTEEEHCMIKHCPRCSNAVEMKTLDRVSAEDAPLKLSVTGMPAAKCARARRADRPRLHAVADPGGQDPRRRACRRRSERDGLQEIHLHLRQGLESVGEAPLLPARATPTRAPAFKAELDMPVYKCTGCGKELLRSAKELQGHAAQAIAALNDAAGFPHSG